MLYNSDFDKMYFRMAHKFEKMISCDRVAILKIKEERLEWLNPYDNLRNPIKRKLLNLSL